MANDYRDDVARVFVGVVERMAFMFAERVDKDEFPASIEQAVRTEMKFSGPIRGTLELTVAARLCPEVAANSLGVDVDDEGAKARGIDALKELLNVVCGNVLTEISGDEPVFNLTIPEDSAVGAEQWDAIRSGAGSVYLLVDDHPAILRLRLDSS